MVKGLRCNLLGLPAIKALNLAVRIIKTTTSMTSLNSSNVYKKFRKMLVGLGNLGEEYHMQVKPAANH